MEYVRVRTIVISGLVLALVIALTVVVLREVLRPGPGCTTAVGDRRGPVTVEQADNAATIAGVGLAMGMPDHAVTVALATALQESGLRNLPGGDRDSAGLFQQRPSQGWGTYAQVTDPVHAAGAFYAKLRSEPDWTTLSVTQAAQLVQRSASPEAYARWEPVARSLARALTGEDPARADLPRPHPGGAGRRRGPARRRRAGHGPAVGRASRPRGAGPSRPGSWRTQPGLGLDAVTFDGRTWTAENGAVGRGRGAGRRCCPSHRASAAAA